MECAECGRANRDAAVYCDGCGTALGPASSERDRIGAPAAEHRMVTVLFADAQGSTALAEAIGDEELYRLMQTCVAAMADAVEAHRGHVAQFRGDGIMALFGAPVATEGAAVEAVTAALEMQPALRRIGADLSERLGHTCRFRIGLNTGPVVVGTLAGQTVVDYTAIGDTANVASRLEQSAGPGEVLISETTWRAVRDYVDSDVVGDLELKGKAGPVRVHRALRRRDVRSRLEAVEGRGLSRFVGRGDVLGLLDDLVASIDTGERGAVVSLVGEAGIGKSRLLREARDRLPHQFQWVEGRASASDRGTPWYVMDDLLRRWFGIVEQDDADVVAEKVRRAAGRWLGDVDATAVEYLLWVLGSDDANLGTSDPKERRAGAVAAVTAVLAAAAARGPLVVVIEDLHWADDVSVQAAREVSRSAEGCGMLVIVTARTGYAAAVEAVGGTTVVLDELSAADATTLSAAVAGGELSPAAHDLIVERTGGNPLFVEELTAALAETGELAATSDGRLDLTVRAADITVPTTLHDVVLARVDRLDSEARQALQLASVIGREFTRRLLERISASSGTLDAPIEQLESLELIHQAAVQPELVYLFKHAVVHEITYSTMLAERRRELHGAVATAIEELYGDRRGEHCESLARHWLAADSEARAFEPLALSAEKAHAGYAMPAALEAYEHAVGIAGRLGLHEQQVALLRGLLAVHDDLGDWDAVVKTTHRLSAAANRLGDLDAEAMALAYRCQAITWRHDYKTALGVSRQARSFAEAHLHAGVRVETFVEVAGAAQLLFMVLGRFDDFDELAARVDEVRAADPAARPSAGFADMSRIMVANWRGRWSRSVGAGTPAGRQRPPTLVTWGAALHLAGLGRFAEAVELLDDALRDGERIGEMFVRARVLNTLGFIHYEVGDMVRAAEWNRASLDPALDVGLPKVALNARLNLADVHLALGHLDLAATELDEVGRSVRQPDQHDEWMLWRYGQHYVCTSGELALAGDEPTEALARADEAMAWAAERDSPKYQVRAQRLRGRALSAMGRGTEARTEMLAAADGARRLGNPPQLWRTLSALAELDDVDPLVAATEGLAVLDGVVHELGDSPLASSLQGSAERRALVEHLPAQPH